MYLSISAAIGCIVAAILAAVDPTWIESLGGGAVDGGDGTLEVAIPLFPLACAIAFAAYARSHRAVRA